MSIANEMFAEVTIKVRKPVNEVYNAFVDPSVTTHFWFTKSTGRLTPGADIEWMWEMYNLTAPVKVLEIEENKKIVIRWGSGVHESFVEWTFSSLSNTESRVTVINRGFKGSESEVIAWLKDSSSGFAYVLAGLKAYLEHGIHLNLVLDK